MIKQRSEAFAAASALAKLPEGGWPETQQARRRLAEAIWTCREGRTFYIRPKGAPVASFSDAEDAWLNAAPMEQLAALEARIEDQKQFIAEQYAEANAQGILIPANVVSMKRLLQKLVNEYNALSTTIQEGF